MKTPIMILFYGIVGVINLAVYEAAADLCMDDYSFRAGLMLFGFATTFIIIRNIGIVISKMEPRKLFAHPALGAPYTATEPKISDPYKMITENQEKFEKAFIIKALKMFKGRVRHTALHCNIPLNTLKAKMENFGINPEDYK